MLKISGQIPTTLITHLSQKHKDVMKALDELNNLGIIQSTIQGTRQQIEKLQKEHDENIHKLKESIRDTQKRCGHELRETYSDPAGGSDKSVVCQICDLEL